MIIKIKFSLLHKFTNFPRLKLQIVLRANNIHVRNSF